MKGSVLYMIVALVMATVVGCQSTKKRFISDENTQNHADSVMFAVGDSRDTERMLTACDSLERLGELSPVRCMFFRTIAYNMRGQYRKSLKEYYHLANIDPDTLTDQGDFEVYTYLYHNYLRLLCDMKRYDAALREAYFADERLKAAGYDEFTDYHDVAQAIGESQLYLGQDSMAKASFERAMESINARLAKFKDPLDYRECQSTMRAIAMAYIHKSRYTEALPWIERQIALYVAAKERPDRDTVYLDEMKADINYCKSLHLWGVGDKAYAERAFKTYKSTQTAQSLVSTINSSEYLMETERYDEAVRNYERLDQFFSESGYEVDLENIGRYLIPKYRANLLAGRKDSAMKVGMMIAEAYDSALVRQKSTDAVLLANIYDMEGKERQIAEQRAELSHQRMLWVVGVSVVFIILLHLFLVMRRKTYNKLKEANRQLTLAHERTEELSQMKSKFIKDVFHEVRTPLNALTGFAQVMANPDINISQEEMQSISKMMVENSERITKIVDKMLDFDPSRDDDESKEEKTADSV